MDEEAPQELRPAAPSERLPAVWPWLLIPLVALALFFTLRSMRAEPDASSATAVTNVR